LLITLAIIFYNDIFYFWAYPFSYLGAANTFDPVTVYFKDNPNILSSLIYSLDMFLSAVIMLFLTLKIYTTHSKENSVFKTMLCFLASFGFLIASFSPDDTRHNFHVLGSALVVASFWILATNYLFEIKDSLKIIKYYSLQIVLQVPIFTYAGFYFLNMDPYSEILQKFALLGLCVVLLYATKKIKYSE
jgi:hypothetical protein